MTTPKKLLIYKIAIFIFAFIVAFMPTTVSRSREVNSRVIVEILGLDGGDEISVTAQYVMPTGEQGATSKDTVTVGGATLEEAVETLSTALGRRAELGHCSMVIVGKDAGPELLGTLMTATDVTADVYLAAAEDKAEELVGQITDFMKKTGATDADFIAYGAKKSHVATNTLLGFLCDIGSASHSSFMPVVSMIESEKNKSDSSQNGGEGGGESKDGEGGGSSEKSGGGESSGMNVEKLALYSPQGRCGILDRTAARGVAWVSSPIEKGILTADVSVDGETINDVSARLLKKHVDITTDAKNNAAKIKIRAIIEPRGDKFNRLDAKNSAAASMAIKDGFSQAVKSELRAAYDSAALCDCDPLFIGREFYRYAPDYFENGYNAKTVDVTFDVEIVIK